MAAFLATPAMPALPSPAAITSLGAAVKAGANPPIDANGKARAAATDFEAVFLNSMFQHMYTGIEGDGPFGNSAGVGPWRSFLTEEYAKNFVRSGGIGIADHVYRSLLAHQEARQ